MDLAKLREKQVRETYLFNPESYGRIFTFVDFANVRSWAKTFWPQDNKHQLKREIDIHKLAEIINYVSPLKKYFYYGHYKEYPELPAEHDLSAKYRQSIFRIDKARKCGFTVRTKDVKEINNFDVDGRFLGKISKCNFDVEVAMDMLQKIEKYDTVFLWSGDSDFHVLLNYLRSKKKKIVTICARDFLSKELNESSDLVLPADGLKDHLEYIKGV